MARRNPIEELLARAGLSAAPADLFGGLTRETWRAARAGEDAAGAFDDDTDPGDGRRAAREYFRGSVEIRSSLSSVSRRVDRARDISEEGMFVETAEPLDVGDPVVITIQTGRGPVQVNGRVRWVSAFGRLDDPTPGMGIEFVGVDESKRARISEVLKPPSKRDPGRAEPA